MTSCMFPSSQSSRKACFKDFFWGVATVPLRIFVKQNMQSVCLVCGSYFLSLNLVIKCSSWLSSISFRLGCLTHEYLIRIHVPRVVITNNHNMIALTVFFQLPVAVHLPLGLNPVAAVCPQRGLGLGNHSSAWKRHDSNCVMEMLVVPVNCKEL